MEFRFDPRERRLHIRTLIPPGRESRSFVPDDQFQFGIEEEYFLSDAETFEVPAETPDALFQAASFGTPGHIGREFLQSQSKSRPSRNTIRRRRADRAAPIAAERCRCRRGARPCDIGMRNASARLLAGVGAEPERPLCAGHGRSANDRPAQYAVRHACPCRVSGSDAPGRRDDANAALSAVVHRACDIVAVLAGPATGLKGYRLAAYDELPRTGLPEFSAPMRNTTPMSTPWCAPARWRMPVICGGRSGPRSNIRPWSCGRRTAAPGSTTRSRSRRSIGRWPASCMAIPSTMPGSALSTGRLPSRTNGGPSVMAYRAPS